ncbi:hypothetical protein ABBQ38_001518 [Trebouxia sp. C0009 RCD-2024]
MSLPAVQEGRLHLVTDPKLRGISSLSHCFGARTTRPSRIIPRAAQRKNTTKLQPKQASTGKRSGQVEIDEIPFFDRFHNSITGFPFPLGPFLQRRTIRKQVDKGRLWLFEQEQTLGGSNVTTVIRMTVLKLNSGNLWVHAPVAPTRECVRLVKELGLPVEFIVLPTFAYEHKIFLGPFARAFPDAKVWIAPRQWSWPLPLPVQFFGIFPTGGTITEDDQELPWSDEIEHKIFISAIGGASAGVGPYVEVVFLHKQSKTLIVTDAVVCVPPSPPQVVRTANLLEAGSPLPGLIRGLSSLDDDRGFKDKFLDGQMEQPAESEEAQVQLGWKRMALQILYFVPGNLLNPELSFRALSERLVVSPVLQTLVYSKNPEGARQWVDKVTSDWSFKRVIPAHFDAPVAAGPKDFRQAFQFLWDIKDNVPTQASSVEAQQQQNLLARLFSRKPQEPFRPPASDMRALNGLESVLTKAGVFSK